MRTFVARKVPYNLAMLRSLCSRRFGTSAARLALYELGIDTLPGAGIASRSANFYAAEMTTILGRGAWREKRIVAISRNVHVSVWNESSRIYIHSKTRLEEENCFDSLENENS